VPLAEDSLLRAIELNGVAVEFNRKAFAGPSRRRRHREGGTACDSGRGRLDIAGTFTQSRRADPRRVEFLTAYQDAAYAARYTTLLERVRAASRSSAQEPRSPRPSPVRFKLMAYKDEYEVARLHADPAFARKIEACSKAVHPQVSPCPPVFSKPIRAREKRANRSSVRG